MELWNRGIGKRKLKQDQRRFPKFSIVKKKKEKKVLSGIDTGFVFSLFF